MREIRKLLCARWPPFIHENSLQSTGNINISLWHIRDERKGDSCARRPHIHENSLQWTSNINIIYLKAKIITQLTFKLWASISSYQKAHQAHTAYYGRLGKATENRERPRGKTVFSKSYKVLCSFNALIEYWAQNWAQF